MHSNCRQTELVVSGSTEKKITERLESILVINKGLEHSVTISVTDQNNDRDDKNLRLLLVVYVHTDCNKKKKKN